ncbi:MAG: hypothetical protein IJK99_08900 [Bacteroidales bacterium]|nr:hypothetical protein [Bacteroidales bacterium]
MNNRITDELHAMTDGLDLWLQRRQRRRSAVAVAASFAVVLTAGLLTVSTLPVPDGKYVSSVAHRGEVLTLIDKTLTAKL